MDKLVQKNLDKLKQGVEERKRMDNYEYIIVMAMLLIFQIVVTLIVVG